MLPCATSRNRPQRSASASAADSLGLLHMEIIQERIEREFNIPLITTAPSVIYKVTLTNGEVMEIDNPSNYPEAGKIDFVEEPYVKAAIIVPNDYVGAIMELCQNKRGEFINMEYLDTNRVTLTYQRAAVGNRLRFLRPAEIKHEGLCFVRLRDYRATADPIWSKWTSCSTTSRSMHCPSSFTATVPTTAARVICEKLKELIPRQMFEVPIQASIGTKIIARETVKAMRKNVLAKCYGGDISRKRKLLEKQKEGKKRMKQVGNVEVPQEAFMAVLKIDED